ncbi:hypothetical protein [Kineococcus terrestris]|uniref:hypothetical protein n=1 Tax=Kineococcus terrestris TaxID=2044856 RepID=UPI0034DB17B4
MASQDNYQVVVSYDGRPAGTWDSHSGGGKTHDNQTYRRGGMGGRVAQPSQATYDDLTISRLAGDDPALERRMLTDPISRAMTVTVYPLGVDGVRDPRRQPTVYRGRFAGCTPPDSDSNGTDTSVFEVTMTVEDVQ